jgi:hypothetical protein
MNIESTSNYALFKPHGEQQPMNPTHVKRMMASINKNGYIKSKPVHVYRDGKFLRVIDGHHRIAACEALEIPVYYVIGQKSEANLISDLNYAVRKWSGDAFIAMYASRGMKDYVTLLGYINRGIPITQAACMLAGESTASGNHNESLRAGTFKVRSTDSVDAVLEIIDELAPINPEVKGRTFIAAIGVMVHLAEFDRGSFIWKVKSNPRMLVKCANRAQMFDLIEEIYNFRAREKHNLAFLAQSYLNGRNKFQKDKHA